MIDFGAQMGRVRFHSDVTAEGKTMRSMSIVCAGIVLICATASPANAAISESQTLVVYNSASSEGTELKDAYLAAHPGIPEINVLDLADPLLLKSDLTREEFAGNLQLRIRWYLTILGGEHPNPEDIIAIVLLRPMPHRILDSDNPLVGDDPIAAGAEFDDGDATYASVDSELTLLFQNIFAVDPGGTMDSYLDNVIASPYGIADHLEEIDTFSRSNITVQKAFFESTFEKFWYSSGSGSTLLTSGDIYLVCRIDGATQADALALIDRAQGLTVNRATTIALFDIFEDAPLNIQSDYEGIANVLSNVGWNTRYDGTFEFVDSNEEPRPLIAYASFGENHSIDGQGEDPPGAGTYIDGFAFVPGAIFNSVESFNARGFNGLGTLLDQEQIADFVTAGGTFAIGNVFEQFEYGQQQIPYVFYHMLVSRWTWAEAAYSSIPYLSAQTIVLGDPLARFETIVDIEGDCNADISVDLADYNSFATCLAQSPTGVGLACECFDFNADTAVDLADFAELQVFFDLK